MGWADQHHLKLISLLNSVHRVTSTRLLSCLDLRLTFSFSRFILVCAQARPMTRYLPIRKEEFDLRSHVESSGHSVDTCYQVILTEKMCKGYLVKMGGKIKSWKKRWFVFDRLKRTFSYYVGKKRDLISLDTGLLNSWRCRYFLLLCAPPQHFLGAWLSPKDTNTRLRIRKCRAVILLANVTSLLQQVKLE